MSSPSFLSRHVHLSRWLGTDGGHPYGGSGGTTSGNPSCTCHLKPRPSCSSCPIGHCAPFFLARCYVSSSSTTTSWLGNQYHPNKQATYTALHYTQELLTTFGLMHITRFDPDELAAELRGISSNFQNWARTFTPPGGEPPLPSSTTSLGAASGPIDTVSTRRSPHTTTRPRPGLPRPRERSRSRVRLSPHYTLVSPYFNLFAQNAATFVPNSSPLDRPSRSPTRCDVMTIPMGKNFEL